MIQKLIIVIFVLISISVPICSGSACYNDCSGQGTCTKWATCNCFTGFEGNDCSRRTCPSGPQYADIPYDTDSAHKSLTCSGQGTCNYKTGICQCKTGYYGVNCGHMKCFNDCSGNGHCISLRTAATLNNGYNFNRTTVYNKWDADIIFGCNCDPGWSGPDCSERVCEYGVDPRLSDLSNEVVTLACTCTTTCSGKFKLQFLGRVADKWFLPTSLGSDIATALMKVPGVLNNVVAVNGSQPVCASSSTTYTLIKFKRNAGDLPAISFYANLITSGSLYFETAQYLSCHCLGVYCTGTFRVSFDGEMSAKLSISDTGSSLITALNSMRTIQAAGITVATGTPLTFPICQSGAVHNHSILFQAALGNVPRLGLWTSIIVSPGSYSPTFVPTSGPSALPSFSPSSAPTFAPSVSPSVDPTFAPTFEPTFAPTFSPSVDPTFAPTFEPTVAPTFAPTYELTDAPTLEPTTATPTTTSVAPTYGPTFSPTFSPSFRPTLSPSYAPTLSPSYAPTFGPTTLNPTKSPTCEPTYYPSVSPTVFITNLSSVLLLTTSDGRDDHVKLCNGVGKCDFSSGVCSCPYGWGFDDSVGTCGKLLVNTSQWAGVARCPGVSNPFTQDGIVKDVSDRQNYPTRIYVSVNPSSSSKNTVHGNYSGIYYYTWNPSVNSITTGVKKTLFVNLTSHLSAGPMVLDQAKSRIFYVDMNPANYFIGVAYISTYSTYSTNNSIWLESSEKIFGFAMDAYFSRRKLYWTTPGSTNAADGNIYYAYMDANPPIAYSLTAAIGQSYVIDPHGIAVHYVNSRIYWVDRDSTRSHSVLRSCAFDGTGYTQNVLYRVVDNHTVSTNVTDLVIDFSHNNTAMFIDSSFPAAIIATNLDAPITYDTQVTDDFVFSGYLAESVILTTYELNMTSPQYLAVDEWSKLLLFSDVSSVGAVRYKKDQYANPNSPGISLQHVSPVGLLIDRGLGSPQWGEYLDCYGNGVCQGLAGNFVCLCHNGYYGDCQARSCPTGYAWFHEPAVDNVAHDELVECSNMGLCDRSTGACQCRPGFEGSACERMSCQGDDRNCNNHGRCLSMRHLGDYNKDVFRQPDPVVYGSLPNSADTWDADMIYGCAADDYGYYDTLHNITSYSGSALDELQCPNGYNVRLLDKVYTNATSYNATYSKSDNTTITNFRKIQASGYIANYTQLNEIQTISCKAISGAFYLSFRGYETTQLSYNVTAPELLAALKALPSIGLITVTYYSVGQNAGLCHRSDGRYAQIIFETEIGYVPLIKVASSTLYGNHIHVYRIQAGSTLGLLECAGKGECNRQTGECMCWPNRGSSDGFGNVGNRGDCGFNLIY